MTLLLPCCTFLRVFDTMPEREVLTLPELTAALRRFEVKTQTAAKIEREIARIRQASARLAAGEPVRGKFMGRLAKARESATRAGEEPARALVTATEHMVVETEKSAKRDLRLWSPAHYRPGATKRGSDGVTHVSCLVLDYDDGTAIREATTTWSSWFHLVYTTWSHTPTSPRFRLVLPLAFAVASEDWPSVWSWAEEHAHFSIDPAMKSPAATYALPAVRSLEWPREAFSRPGAILDPVDVGVLARRTRLALEPLRPPHGTPSALRGEDPEKEYVDHLDEDAVYFVDEPWESDADWDPAPLAGPAPIAAPIAAAEPPPDPPARAPASGLVDALERLEALHARGFLSDDEVALAKAKLLAPEPGAPPPRPRIGVDFDGVLHSYASGWRGAAVVADPPVAGAIDWLVALDERFDLAIVSVRNAHPEGPTAMRAWLGAHGLPDRVLSRIAFPASLPADLSVLIDDRAFRFEGRFPTWDELGRLVPWHERP